MSVCHSPLLKNESISVGASEEAVFFHSLSLAENRAHLPHIDPALEGTFKALLQMINSEIVL